MFLLTYTYLLYDNYEHRMTIGIGYIQGISNVTSKL